MPTKIPVRGEFNESGEPIGLAEYQTNEYVDTTFGGTGYATYSNGQVLIGNSSGKLTANTISGEAGKITVTTGNGTIEIGLDSSFSVGMATATTLGTVKVPTTGGLGIDTSGNITHGVVEESADQTFTVGEANFQIPSQITVDDFGHVTEITKATIRAEDASSTAGHGIQLVSEDSVMRLKVGPIVDCGTMS